MKKDEGELKGRKAFLNGGTLNSYKGTEVE